MTDYSMVANFLSPEKNINRYKKFPEWTKRLNAAKLGENHRAAVGP